MGNGNLGKEERRKEKKKANQQNTLTAAELSLCQQCCGGQAFKAAVPPLQLAAPLPAGSQRCTQQCGSVQMGDLLRFALVPHVVTCRLMKHVGRMYSECFSRWGMALL